MQKRLPAGVVSGENGAVQRIGNAGGMSESMVERVARALWDHMQKDWPSRIQESWDAEDALGRVVSELKKNYQRDLARAAIEAMREPTKEMISAVYLGSLAQLETSAEDVWHSMISAALHPQKGEGE